MEEHGGLSAGLGGFFPSLGPRPGIDLWRYDRWIRGRWCFERRAGKRGCSERMKQIHEA